MASKYNGEARCMRVCETTPWPVSPAKELKRDCASSEGSSCFAVTSIYPKSALVDKCAISLDGRKGRRELVLRSGK